MASNITIPKASKSDESIKISALSNRDKNDKFMISWAGKWSTDVFEVSEEDIIEVIYTYGN